MQGARIETLSYPARAGDGYGWMSMTFNPLQDVAAVENVRFVMKGGEVFAAP